MERDDEKVLKLRKPIIVGDVTYEELTLREPNAGQIMRAVKAGPNDTTQQIALIVAVTGVPIAVVEKMGVRDFAEAASWLVSFFERGTTGETASPS